MSLSLTFSSLAYQIICFDVLEEQLFCGCKLCEDLLRLDCVLSAQWSWIFSSDFNKFYFSKQKNICMCECVWMQSTWVRFICTWSAEARKGCWVISPITLCIFSLRQGLSLSQEMVFCQLYWNQSSQHSSCLWTLKHCVTRACKNTPGLLNEPAVTWALIVVQQAPLTDEPYLQPSTVLFKFLQYSSFCSLHFFFLATWMYEWSCDTT